MDAGAALIHLCEGGMFGSMFGRGQYKDRLAPVLRSAHRDFLMWKKQQKLQCSHLLGLTELFKQAFWHKYNMFPSVLLVKQC